MLELHGWLTIHDTYGNEDELSDKDLNTINNRIKEIINSHNCGITLRYANGESFLEVLHCSNHHTAEADEILDVFKEVSKVADGSYGIIYLRDDEDKTCYNEFQVFVFKHGIFTKTKDTLLSPCIPEIEADIYNNDTQKED